MHQLVAIILVNGMLLLTLAQTCKIHLFTHCARLWQMYIVQVQRACWLPVALLQELQLPGQGGRRQNLCER